MKKNTDYRIIIKIYSIVFVALMGMMGIVVSNDYQNNKIYEAASYATVNTVPSVLAVGGALSQFYALRVAIRDHILNEDQIKSESIEQEIQKHTKSIKTIFAEYESALLSNDEDKKLLGIDKAYFESYLTSTKIPLTLSLRNKNIEARNALENTSDVTRKLEEALNIHLEFNKNLAIDGARNALAIKEHSVQMSLIIATFVLSFISLMGCIFLLFF